MCKGVFYENDKNMIRKMEPREIDLVMAIWLDVNIEAHAFISADYWETNYPFVKEAILSAEIYVYEESGDILGFIGLDNGYIAGIFVLPSARSKGIGKKLLHFVKKQNSVLSLDVYAENERAIKFYKQDGFYVTEESTDAHTGHAELHMEWTQVGGERLADQKRCDECGSLFFKEASAMENLCPECAHILYGYENCPHRFENGHCVLCGWDGSRSDYIGRLLDSSAEK